MNDESMSQDHVGDNSSKDKAQHENQNQAPNHTAPPNGNNVTETPTKSMAILFVDGTVTVLLWIVSEYFGKYSHISWLSGLFLYLALLTGLFGAAYLLFKWWHNFKGVLAIYLICATVMAIVPFKCAPQPEKWHPPELPPGCETVYVTFGDGKFGHTISDLKKGAIFIQTDGIPPFTGYVTNNRFYVNANLAGPSGMINIIGQEMANPTALPLNWDCNKNTNAIEIVNENNFPILQVYYRRPDQVVVRGVFWIGSQSLIYANDDGFGEYTDFKYLQSTRRAIKPIFKYPAWNHQGEYVN